MQETSHFAAGPQYTLECKWSERKLKINERAKKVVRERQTSWIFKINFPKRFVEYKNGKSCKIENF